MNKADVMRQVAQRTGQPVGYVETVAEEFLQVITDALSQGDVVSIRRFGRFELRVRRAVRRLNPATLEPMDIPDRITATFLPSEILRGRLNP